MDFAYSPHREGGGTLHLHLSPTHRHGYGLDPQSSLQLIRRSLSRSPSKPSRFHSSRWTDSPSLPISPLAHSRAFSPKSPHTEPRLFSDHAALQPKKRLPMRRPAALRSSPRRRNPSKSPRRRALADSTDQGNAPPSNIWLVSADDNTMGRRSGGALFDFENAAATEPRASTMRLFEDKPIKFDISSTRQDPPTPGAPTKSSALKRSDDIMNFPAADVGTPIAKRRSVHGPSVLGENESSVFDRVNIAQTPSDPGTFKLNFNNVPSPSPFSLSPAPAHTPLRKSASLRRTTVSQRHIANSTPKPDGVFAIPFSAASKAKQRMSLDGPKGAGGSQSPMRRTSIPGDTRPPFQHSLFRPAANTHQPHPLSHALSPSFSTPDKEGDTDMGAPAPAPAAPRNPAFSKSLPIGAARPFVLESSTAPSFETPSAFKMAKPNPSAFMSTGLLTKKNRLVDETSIHKYVMPGTPSKRASFPPVTASPSVNRRNIFGSKIQRPEFGQPSTPFSLHKQSSSASFGKGVNIFGSTNKSLRRSSFASMDGEENSAWPFGEINPDSPFAKHMSDSQSSHDDSMPPTPTKQSDACGRRKDSSLRRQTFGRARSSLGADTFAEPEDIDTTILDFDDAALDVSPEQTAPPHTPNEAFAPPDPSVLSISGQRRGSLPFNASTSSELFPPATPTTPRDHSSFFKSSGFNVAPITGLTENDVDQSLADRFDSFSLWGDGEFSKVYRAEKFADRRPGFLSSPVPRIYAVKKTKKPYAGPYDREKKLKEVRILFALRGHDHIVSYEDHWEHQGHLYIQTEFCEEGNLQRFLAQTGNKGRLDSFRIWKILMEVASGVDFIHESGYIHLDLKPANILITFDGVLKIADFGLATPWPATKDIDGEGDRHYLAPEAMGGRYDKPCDIFALGVIMCEIACNVEMPENGTSWQKLRSGDFSELPSLTFSSESTLDRDVNGDPIYPDGENETEDLFASNGEDDVHDVIVPPVRYSGGLATPPSFMVDDSDPDSLHQIVQCMMNPEPSLRPTVEQVYGCYGCQWVSARSRAGATIFEGNWGPADDVLNHKAEEGVDVEEVDKMDTD